MCDTEIFNAVDAQATVIRRGMKWAAGPCWCVLYYRLHASTYMHTHPYTIAMLTSVEQWVGSVAQTLERHNHSARNGKGENLS